MRQTEIIAEIGVNHQNDLGIARDLIRQAKIAGADVVKFQASTVVEEVSYRAAPDHFEDLGKLVPTWDFLKQCRDYALAEGIEFMCTPAGAESLMFVRYELDCPRLKIASDNLNNVEFLQHAASIYADRPILLSTGMGDLHEIKLALQYLSPSIVPRMDVTVMHCTSAYPCPLDRVNLRALWQLSIHLPQPIGYSDHTTSLIVPALAVALGATVIEKHLTLNQDWDGPDHRASLDPAQFRQMVQNVRDAEATLIGGGAKHRLDIEEAGAALYRKSLVARTAIKAGEPYSIENLTAKRPGSGVPAANWARYIGHVAGRDYAEDELIEAN